MPRIGHAIREVYRRPGADALPAHLEARYGIHVTGTTKLGTGVLRVDHDGGPPWVARLMLSARPVQRTDQDAEVLRFLERRGFPAERCADAKPVSTLDGRAVPRHAAEALDGYRPHVSLTAGELDRVEGVLWTRILWLSAWQCWLACVSAKVHQAFYPRREYITALAAKVRAVA